MSAVNRKKLVWHCRRGTRELDYMTCYYLENHYDASDVAHQHAFELLLELPDPQLHAVLTGQVESSNPETTEIVRLIRNYEH